MALDLRRLNFPLPLTHLMQELDPFGTASRCPFRGSTERVLRGLTTLLCNLQESTLTGLLEVVFSMASQEVGSQSFVRIQLTGFLYKAKSQKTIAKSCGTNCADGSGPGDVPCRASGPSSGYGVHVLGADCRPGISSGP